MDPSKLIPSPEAIPAPWWVLESLGVMTLMIHLLFINVALGGSILVLYSRLRSAGRPEEGGLPGLLAGKIPIALAAGITFGVAPLLFFQVLYGHFFYSSSILMAVFWIMVIPLLILGYYGAYIHARKGVKAPALATAAIAATVIVLLYIAFAFQNNISLMLHPGKWLFYFTNRKGTLLNLSDPALWPRFFHFITASVAVAGLFSATVWSIRQRRGVEGAGEKIISGLRIFAFTTMVQVVFGFWFLLALPREVMMQFMGGNVLYTVMLSAGIILALAGIMTAILGRLALTIGTLLATVAVMIFLRTCLRYAYLEKYFQVTNLPLSAQYDVLLLFLVILVSGLIIVGTMLRWIVGSEKRKGAP